jgi:hypothetical protein
MSKRKVTMIACTRCGIEGEAVELELDVEMLEGGALIDVTTQADAVEGLEGSNKADREEVYFCDACRAFFEVFLMSGNPEGREKLGMGEDPLWKAAQALVDPAARRQLGEGLGSRIKAAVARLYERS